VLLLIYLDNAVETKGWIISKNREIEFYIGEFFSL